MANTLADAIRLAKNNRNSPNSIKLQEAILDGKMDDIAQQEGLDLSAYKQHFKSKTTSVAEDPRKTLQTQLQAGEIPDTETLLDVQASILKSGAQKSEQIKSKLQEGVSPTRKFLAPVQEFLAPNDEQLAKKKADVAQRIIAAGGNPDDYSNIIDNQGGVADPAIGAAKSLLNTGANLTMLGKEHLIDPVSEFIKGAISGEDAAKKLHEENQSLYEAVRNHLAPTESQKSAYNSTNTLQWFVPFLETAKGASLLAKVVTNAAQGGAIGAGQSGSLSSPEALWGAIFSGAVPVAGKVAEEVYGAFQGSKTVGALKDAGKLKQSKLSPADLTKAVDAEVPMVEPQAPNFKGMTATEKAAAANKTNPIIEPDVSSVAKKAQSLGENIDKKLTQDYQAGIDKMVSKYGKQEFPAVVSDTKSTVEKIFAKEKIKIKKGELNFKDSVISGSDEALVRDFYNELKAKKVFTADDLRILNQRLADIKSAAYRSGGSASAITQQMYNSFRDTLGLSIKEVKALNQAYSEGLNIISGTKGHLGNALNTEAKFLNLDKPGKKITQQGITAAEDYAKKQGIIHEGNIVEESKAIAETTRKSKIENAVAKEKLKAAEDAAKVKLKIADKEAQAVRKAFANKTKEQIATAAKKVNMETEKFNTLMREAFEGKEAAVLELINAAKKHAGTSIIKGAFFALGVGGVGSAAGPLIYKMLFGKD